MASTPVSETMKAWVEASYRVTPASDFMLAMEVQELGRISLLLNGMESDLPEHDSERAKSEVEMERLGLLISISRLWVLGLYETLRTLRETVGKTSDQWVPIAPLFATVEDIRMPLAKHQPQGQRKAYHVAQPTLLVDRRIVGWNVYVRSKSDVWPIARRELAEQFLDAVAMLPRK